MASLSFHGSERLLSLSTALGQLGYTSRIHSPFPRMTVSYPGQKKEVVVHLPSPHAPFDIQMLGRERPSGIWVSLSSFNAQPSFTEDELQDLGFEMVRMLLENIGIGGSPSIMNLSARDTLHAPYILYFLEDMQRSL